MKLQLFNPPVSHYLGGRYRINPPLGLPIIAALFNATNEHRAEVVDLEALGISPQALGELFRRQVERWPDVVGFTSLFSSARGVRESIRALRGAAYRGRIAVGGPYATLRPDEVQSWGADLVVTGECEGNVVQLLEGGAMGIQQGKAAKMEDIPIPDWKHHSPSPQLYEGNAPHLGRPEGLVLMSRGCPHQCLTGDTLISLIDGGQIPIKDVEAGMIVWGSDLATGQRTAQVVLESVQTSPYRQDLLRIESADGNVLTCTADHRVWTKRGWIEARNLTLDDEVLSDNRKRETHVYRGRETTDQPRTQGSFQRRSGARSLCADNRASRTDERTCEGNAGRWAVEAQASHVRSRESDASSTDALTGSAGEGQGCTTDTRIPCTTGRTSETVVCRGGVPSEIGDIGRGATSQQRAYEERQSCQTTGSARENTTDFARSTRTTLRACEGAACRGTIRGACIDVRRTSAEQQRAHENQQSDEAPRSCSQGCGIPASEIYRRSEVCSRAMGTSRCRSEQGGIAIADDTRTAGRSIRGGWEFLDRPLPEWGGAEPGLYLQVGPNQDSHLAAQQVLAQESRTGYSGTCGLPELRMAGFGDLGSGTQRTNDGLCESAELAGWSRIISITPLEEGQPVYDLETWPNHNFFADNVLVHNCVFCGNPVFGRQKIRYRPPENIEAELIALKSQGFRALFVYDDELLGVPYRNNWLQETMGRIAPLEFVWKCQGRCSKKFITREVLETAYKGGCRAVMWGVESFSQRVLDANKKNTTLEDIWHTLRTAKEVGIKNWVFSMVGMYEETDEDAELTAKGLEEAYREGLIDYRQTTVTTVLPGTPLESLAKEQGWYTPPPESGPQMHQTYQSTPWMSAERIAYWFKKYAEVCPVDHLGKVVTL